jgi:hypothetical protein
MRCLAALLLFAIPSVALAQDLTWRWHEQEVVSYRIQTYMQFRYGELRLIAAKNIDARIEDLALGIETDCRSVSLTRRTQALECRIRKAELGLTALPAEQEKANLIAAEYSALLANARVQLELTREGRIRTVDIEGISKDTEREGARHEMLRMLVGRAFGGLEFELPKDGDTRGEPWTQGGLPLIMRLPVTSGTVGKAKVRHTVEGQEGSVVTISTSGAGSAQSGAELERAAASRQTARIVEVIWVGTMRFDEQLGVLLHNDYTVQGTLTASANAAGDAFFLTQVGWVQRVDDWEAEDAARRAAIAEEKSAKEAAAKEAAAKEAAAQQDGPAEDPGEPAEPGLQE